MQKRRWAKPAFILLALLDGIYGIRLKRAVINALGGEYSLLTEFRSDVSANLMHRFELFRNFSLAAAFICTVLLGLLLLRGCKMVRSGVAVLLVYAACCCAYFVFRLDMPSAILSFAVKRALCSSLILAIPIVFFDDASV